jgi:hypothetical protein
MRGDGGGSATFHQAATIVGDAPHHGEAAAGEHHGATPNLGLLVMKAILRGLWGGLRGIFRVLKWLPRWAQAAILVMVSGFAIFHVVQIVRNPSIRHGSPALLSPDMNGAAPTATSPTTGAARPVSSAARETVPASSDAHPVAAALPRSPSMADRMRGWLPGSGKSTVQMEVQFKQPVSESAAGKLYRIEWIARVTSGTGIIDNYLVALDGEKPLRISALRPYYSWENLAQGNHRVAVQAESRDGQRSPAAVWEFRIR